MSTTLTVDDLHFDVRRSARRRTLQIAVERSGVLLLSAPAGVDDSSLGDFVNEKRFWIYTKLAEKELLRRTTPRKELIDGEGFLYLGRSYRLKLVDAQDVPLTLSASRFCLHSDSADGGREHFIRWYSERARERLTRFVNELQARMEVRRSGVKVQDLGYRWGSCARATGCTSTGNPSCCRRASSNT